MKKRPQEELGDLFQDSLRDLEVNPRLENWDNISSALESNSFDSSIKDSLDELAVVSENINIDSIRRSMFIRKGFRSITKVAASLAFIFLAYSVYQADQKPELDFAIFTTELNQEDLVYSICENLSLTALDQNKIEVKPIRKRKRKSAKASKTKMLLDFILAEDDGVLSTEDSLKIAEILRPASAPAYENMTASSGYLNTSSKKRSYKYYQMPEVDFKISIPLQILDDQEIEMLLNN